MNKTNNLQPTDRAMIARLSRGAKGGIITVAAAASVLEMPRRTAALKLIALARRGWLMRARRGLYLVKPLEIGPGQRTVAEDPWVLGREAFSPCYVGGWSAAEHWGLTEQIFRSTLIVTAANLRKQKVSLLGHEFRLFKVPAPRTTGAGISHAWRGSERVPVSNAERTLVDCLRRPELGGGIRTLADMMREYGSLRTRRFEGLLEVAGKVATGAAWKRLGYLAEKVWPGAHEVVDAARKHVSAGNSTLDPAVKRKGTLTKRWNLWVNVTIESAPSPS
jgi:predicted transcriptional regulator of viral defense system